MDILFIFGGLLVAFVVAGWSCAKSYFEKGRLQGMEEATREIVRGLSPHYELAGQTVPERVAKAIKGVAAVMVDDGLSDDGAERRHAGRQPRRDASAVQRQIGASGSSCHSLLRLQSRWKIADVRARLVTTPRKGGALHQITPGMADHHLVTTPQKAGLSIR